MSELPHWKLARGYDILVWMDNEGDVVCCGYTVIGERFLKEVQPGYENGDVLQILSDPDMFRETCPTHISVGLVSPNTNKVYPMVTPLLQ